MHHYLPYLIELRRRLIFCLLVISCLFVFYFLNANWLFSWFAHPLSTLLKGNMQAIDVASPLVVPVSLAAYFSLLTAMPFILLQFWQFIKPALFVNERKSGWLFLSGSILLFYLGVLFCFRVVLPLMFAFLVGNVPPAITFSPDISRYLSFSLRMLLIFGLCFELPIIIRFLLMKKIVSKAKLTKTRPYVIVSAFIIGMLLTPPDVISQLLLAIPICLLFELGIWLS